MYSFSSSFFFYKFIFFCFVPFCDTRHLLHSTRAASMKIPFLFPLYTHRIYNTHYTLFCAYKLIFVRKLYSFIYLRSHLASSNYTRSFLYHFFTLLYAYTSLTAILLSTLVLILTSSLRATLDIQVYALKLVEAFAPFLSCGKLYFLSV